MLSTFPVRLAPRAGLLAAALFTTALATAQPAKRYEGVLPVLDPATASPVATRFRVTPDSLVELWQGDAYVRLDPGAVHFIEQGLLQRTPYSLADNVRTEASYEDGEVRVAFARGVGELVALGVLVLWGAGVFGVGAYYRRRARAAEHDAARARSTARLLSEGREAERTRLARDLHDGPLQDLHGLRMRLGVTLRDHRGADASDAALAAVAVDLRTLVEDLRPPVLDDYGLVAALAALGDRLEERHGGLRVTVEGNEPALAEPVRTALYRVAQEAAANAVRHGRARTLRLRVVSIPEAVELSVEDDGAGFEVPADLNDLARARHFGLVGMRERAEQAGGALAVRSAPGAGTTVTLRVERQPERPRRARGRRMAEPA